MRQVTIRRGSLGTLDTLKLIDEIGWEGARIKYVSNFVLTVPLLQWDDTLRHYWHYASEDTETVRSMSFQVGNLMKHGKLIGDCDDAATVAVACANAARLPYRIVAVRSPENSEFEHVFVEIARPSGLKMGHWLKLDPTAPVDADYHFWERMEYSA